MVQIHPDPPGDRGRIFRDVIRGHAGDASGVFIGINGAIAQLGERLPCTQEVGGSIPPGSTTNSRLVPNSSLRLVNNHQVVLLLSFPDNMISIMHCVVFAKQGVFAVYLFTIH